VATKAVSIAPSGRARKSCQWVQNKTMALGILK
jgi:hypothetical protein